LVCDCAITLENEAVTAFLPVYRLVIL